MNRVLQQILQGIWHWTAPNPSIGGTQVSSYWLETSDGLVMIDPLLPEKLPLKRLSSVVRAFVVLVAAAACALPVLFLPASKVWRQTRVEPARNSESSISG